MPLTLLKRNFRSADSPALLDVHIDRLTEVVNALQRSVGAAVSSATITGPAVAAANGGGGDGTGGGGNSGTGSPAATSPDATFLVNNTGQQIPPGTILGFLSNNITIPANAADATLIRAILLATQLYQPGQTIIPISTGVWQVLVDVVHCTAVVTGGDPCYLSDHVSGRTLNRPPAAPSLIQPLGFFLSTVDVSTGVPLAWVAFSPVMSAQIGL